MDKKILERINKNKDWYNKSYSGYPIGIHMQGEAISFETFKNPYAMDYGLVFQNHGAKDHFDWFWNNNELRKKRVKLLKKLSTDSTLSSRALRIGEKNHKNFVSLSDKIARLDLEKLSDKKLKDTFEVLHQELIDICDWSYSVDIFLSDEEVDWLEGLIRKELKSKVTSEIVATLTQPTFPSFVNQAEVLFLKIALSLKKANIKVAEKLSKQYEQRYFWIRSNYKEYSRLSSAQILSEAYEYCKKHNTEEISAKIAHENRIITENINHKKKITKSLRLSKKLQNIIRMSEALTHLQDNRKERVLRMNTLFYEFLEETAQRFSIENPLVFYCTPQEVFSLYKMKRFDMGEIKDRYNKGFLTIFSKGKYTLVPASEYASSITESNFFKDHGSITEIKGSVAYKGVVKGIIRVLKNASDILGFKEGEILVANQTTPEYVPAMKKAIAIITDQGGITCHAAIISRELKLPAIIGTKIATKVLKDGDMVEVDAEKGVVKILK